MNDYHILTVQAPDPLHPAIVQWLRGVLSVEPVEISRPDGHGQWIEVYFERVAQAALAGKVLNDRFPAAVHALRACREKDWQSFRRAHFRRRRIGHRLELIPVWDTMPPDEDRIPIMIDPGLSFGTGDHFTTRFCLEALDGIFAREVPPTMLDAGTGSGILAIAAARLGCPRIRAFDVDSGSLVQARRNLELNQVTAQISLEQRDVTGEPPQGVFDLVCANIYGELLVQAAETLCALTGRRLVLSGIMQREEDRVADAYQQAGLSEVVRDGSGAWTGMIFERITPMEECR
jgi:ribosomal protein L11 methyltransferase